ncbi:MAG: glycoside hydrolase 43 family protein [Bacteroidota bacterium]|nr:glycoside hydrolase 43 family protein [Bacteroidota bacterium]
MIEIKRKNFKVREKVFILLSILLSFSTFSLRAQESTLSKVWVPDNGNGTYKNPVICADYSDPDAIRVGDDFYLTASSFNCVPGLPILHSKDLVNWEIIGYALSKQIPEDVFNKPQHGNGVWAPSIRYHNGEFYIFYPDPDYGIYMVKAKNPAGPWDPPVLIKDGKGLIDPCPLWDDDGNAYLVHAWAGSRAGIKSIITINRMNNEGTKVLDDGVLVFDGHSHYPTIEGPKIYKRNGYYYIFAPAGGVETGWQSVLRSKNIYGPYEDRIVMDQGKTPVNGPHQGAWVELASGESWFLHFQDKGAYGRILHLQPMKWLNDWPVIGIDKNGDGKGEPVLSFKKPNVGKTYPKATPLTSDEFNSNSLGLQWQWHANPQATWAFPVGNQGYLRLFSYPLPEGYTNFWDVPNLLLQKFPAPEFTATTKLTFTPNFEGEKTGLIIMGMNYAYLAVTNQKGKLYVSQTACTNADKQGKEIETEKILLPDNTFYLRVKVEKEAKCTFSYSADGKRFTSLGDPFTALKGKWIGAKVGIFCVRSGKFNDAGYADFDWFRIE